MTAPIPILAEHKQDAYAEARRQWRERVFMPWLAARSLPGSPEKRADEK